MQEGSIEVSVGPETHHLAIDDCLAMQLNQPVTFHNRTRKPARYLVVIAADRARGGRWPVKLIQDLV